MNRMILPGLLALMVVPSASFAAAPVFTVLQAGSTVDFHVNASMTVQGKFDKWTSSLTFTSPDISTAVFKLKVDASSVDTGDGMKNGVLRERQVLRRQE